jgi:UDP-2-acetamido-2-deoxy-ribo-hexuluronate aminotransferase
MQFIDLKSQYASYRGGADGIDARMQAVLDHGRYIMGPEIIEMEEALAERTGVKHCISAASGTDALYLPMLAMDIGPGDEVITVPFTFIATAEIIRLIGATPIFIDVDPVTYNMDANLLEAAITERTKAIVPVSLYGQVPDMEAINAIAERHGIPVLEDAAQSYGATRHGKASGGLSTVGCTSFFPSKPLGCYGDGGALFCNDDHLAKVMRELRAHGQEKRYVHSRIGMNARMDTLQAAVILGKLPHFDDEIEARQRLGARYSEALGDLATTPVTAEGNTHVYGQYTLKVDDRDGLRAALAEVGIPTAVHYPRPLHLQEAFQDLGGTCGDFPVSEFVSEHVVSLPMSPFLTDADQDRVIEAVRNALTA